MTDMLLAAEPVGKGLDGLLVAGITDPAFFTGFKIPVNDIDTGEVFRSKIRGTAELIPVVKKFEKVIVKMDLADSGSGGNDCQYHDPENRVMAAYHKIAQSNKTGNMLFVFSLLDLDRQDRHQGGQEEYRIEQGCSDPHGNNIAQVAERGSIRKIHGQKANGRGHTGDDNRLQVQANGSGNGGITIMTKPHLVEQSHQ